MAAAASMAAVSSSCCAKASPQCSPFSSSLPLPPRRRRAPFKPLHMPAGASLSGGRTRRELVCVKATASSEDSSVPDASKQVQELFEDLKAKYDALENKSQVWIYGGGALVALWLSSIIVGAVNNIPLVPKVLELVGLGYSGWFVYRYLLFKSSRKQLEVDIEQLKLRITGVPRSAFTTEDDE